MNWRTQRNAGSRRKERAKRETLAGLEINQNVFQQTGVQSGMGKRAGAEVLRGPEGRRGSRAAGVATVISQTLTRLAFAMPI